MKAESGPLPRDTRINVRYGSNQDGEPYALGEPPRKQAVFCEEDTTAGGAPPDDAHAGPDERGGTGPSTGGAAGGPPDRVYGLRCSLYTQGPARLDVTASGYEEVDDLDLSLNRKERCDVYVEVTLELLKPDAGT